MGQEPHTTVTPALHAKLTDLLCKPCGRCSIRREHLHFHKHRLLEDLGRQSLPQVGFTTLKSNSRLSLGLFQAPYAASEPSLGFTTPNGWLDPWESSWPVLQHRQPVENGAQAGPGLDADVTPNGRQRAPQGKALFAPAPKQRANDPPVVVQGDGPHVENDGLAPGKPRKCRDNIDFSETSPFSKCAPTVACCCSMKIFTDNVHE